jgi:putative oxidoreductase
MEAAMDAPLSGTGEDRRLVVPALGPLYDRLAPLSWPMVRFVTGAMLVPHGWGKLFGGGLAGTAASFATIFGPNLAWPLAIYIALLEFAGGILLALGLFSRLVALLVAGFMFTATFFVHLPNGFLWTSKGFEYPLFWGLMALAIVFKGGGRWSLDRLLPWEF